MMRLYNNYVVRCREKNRFWGITPEQFLKLTKQNCFYCDREPQQKLRSYVYNGLDRKDTSQGYTPENCLTACKECNFMRGGLSNLTVEETQVMAKALSDYRKKKG